MLHKKVHTHKVMRAYIVRIYTFVGEVPQNFPLSLLVHFVAVRLNNKHVIENLEIVLYNRKRYHTIMSGV